MKMRWYDRILVSLGGVVLMGVGVLVALSGIGAIELPEPFAIDAWLGSGWQWMPILFLVGLLIVAWGVHLLIRPLYSLFGERGGRYYTVKTDDGDGVHISVQALDHLVHKCLEEWPEVLTSQVRMGGQEDAMRIMLRVSLASGVRIPELLANVRTRIREYIEQCSGVTVDKVKIVVEAAKNEGGKEHKTAAKARDVKLLEEADEQVAPIVSPWLQASASEPEEAREPQVTQAAEKTQSEAFLFTASSDAFPFPEWKEDEVEQAAESSEKTEDGIAPHADAWDEGEQPAKEDQSDDAWQ